MDFTSLPRATAQRQLKELVAGGKLKASRRGGKRKYYELTDPETDEATEFYTKLLDIQDRGCEATAKASHVSDKPDEERWPSTS